MIPHNLKVELEDIHDANARKMVEAIDLTKTSMMGVTVSALLVACGCSTLRGNGVALDFVSETGQFSGAFGLVVTAPEHIAKLRQFAAEIEMAQACGRGSLS